MKRVYWLKISRGSYKPVYSVYWSQTKLCQLSEMAQQLIIAGPRKKSYLWRRGNRFEGDFALLPPPSSPAFQKGSVRIIFSLQHTHFPTEMVSSSIMAIFPFPRALFLQLSQKFNFNKEGAAVLWLHYRSVKWSILGISCRVLKCAGRKSGYFSLHVHLESDGFTSPKK